MSERIESGDLVLVVKAMPCCGWDADVGRIEVTTSCFIGRALCCHCQVWATGRFWSIEDPKLPDMFGYLEECLKKIKPLDEGERDETAEPLDSVIAAARHMLV